VVRRCVWSRNLENEEAKARYWAVKIQPQWVVKPGKQTNKQTVHKKWKKGSFLIASTASIADLFICIFSFIYNFISF